MTRILHTFTDVRRQDQLETFAELVYIADVYGDKLVQGYMIEPDDYWAFLLRNWGKEDIVIVEQDVVATLANVDELVLCQSKVCTYPYRLADGKWSVFDIPPETQRQRFNEPFSVVYQDPPRRHAGGTSLGFTKLCVCVQVKIPLHEYPYKVYEWWYLDSFISWHLNRLRQHVHIHSPAVKHNRTPDPVIAY